MANTKSTQHEIPLNGGLNLNKFNAEIKPYEGFNERNSPMYGGCLSPLWIKEGESISTSAISYEGHYYETLNGHLYKDGQSIMTFEQKSFVKSYPNVGVEGTLYDYFDDNNYVIQKPNGEIWVKWRGTDINATQILGITTYQKSVFSVADDGQVYYALSYKYYNFPYNRAKILSGNGEVYEISRYLPLYGGDILSVNRLYVQFDCYIFKRGNTQIPLSITSDYTYSGITTTTTYDVYHYKINVQATMSSFTEEFNVYTNYDENQQDRINNAIRLIFGGLSNFYMFDSDFYQQLLPHTHHNFNVNIPIIFIDPKGTGFTGQSLTCNLSVERLDDSLSINVDFRKFFARAEGVEGVSDTAIRIRFSGYYSDAVTYHTTGELPSPSARTAITIWGLPDYPDNAKDGILCYGNNIPIVLGRISWAPEVTKSMLFFSWEKLCCKTDCTEIRTFEDIEYGIYPGGIQTVFADYSNSFGWRIDAQGDGRVSGISYVPETSSSDYIGTLLIPWDAIDPDKNVYVTPSGIVYYNSDQKSFERLNRIDTNNNSFETIGDYIVINTSSYINCYNVKTGTLQHWGSDYNNNLVSYKPSSPSYDEFYGVFNFSLYENPPTQVLWASGQNINNWADYPLSIKGATIGVYGLDEIDNFTGILRPRPGDLNNVNVYKNIVYYCSFDSNGTKSVNPNMVSAKYEIEEDVAYNIPLLFSAIKGVNDVVLISFGNNVRFSVGFIDNKISYQYYKNSISEYLEAFSIQGQMYGIKNNQIYQASLVNNVLESSVPVVSIEGLNFVANTIYNAYFYSPTARAIYSFGADNNLTMFSQADTVTGITGASYMPSTGSVILGTPDCTYVLNETFGIYRINDIKNFSYANQKDNTVLFVTSSGQTYEVSYEQPSTVDGWTKKDVIIDTQFYGAGSNVVSVNDCWYIRVTDPEHGEGEVKLAVSTLTDIGRTTETKTIKINNKDWDDMTNTVYIRFQPKLQRAVGVSLHLESPFKVAYIGVGATPETLQLNKANI